MRIETLMIFKQQALLSGCLSNLPDNLNPNINGGNLFTVRKHDLSSTSGILKGDAFGLPNDLFVKRFNYKGLFSFLLKFISGGRAKRLWDINLVLFKKGLPVPMPIAYIRPSLKNRHSFYISTVINNADNLGNMYKRGLFSEPEVIADIVGKAVSELHMSGAVHGDLKWSNILIQKDAGEWRPFIIDLDQSRLHEKINFKGVIKDLVRFYRYGLELGAEEWVDTQFFPVYMSQLSDELKVKIDPAGIKKRAIDDWEKKGRRKFKVD